MSRTGATSTTSDNLVLGAGILEIKETSGGSFVKIGATRGGGSFEAGIPLRAIEVDGLQGDTKGLVLKDKGNPTLSATLLEITKENIIKLMPGSQLVGNVITSSGQIKSTDYFYEVRWTGYRPNSSDLIRISIYNALSKEALSLAFVDNDEATIPVAFGGHFDLSATPDSEGFLPEPWQIEFV